MADRYLLESGSPDGYLLEDGSGVYLLDYLQIVNNSGTTVTYLGPSTYQIEKTGNTDGAWDADAVGVDGYTGDFVLRFKVLTFVNSWMVGMNSDPTLNSSYQSLDYAVQEVGTQWQIWESNVSVGGLFAEDTYGWIWRIGTDLYYGVGPTLAAAKVSPQRTVSGVSATLYFDSSILGMGHKIEVMLYEPIPATTLQPSLFTNSQTFHAPTASASYTLTPSLYTDADTFFGPTVARGTVTLTPSPYSDADTFFGPTVLSTKTLSPALFTDGDTFHAPAVTASKTLSPALYANTQTFHIPTAQASYSLIPALVVNGQSFPAPAVTTSYALLASLFANDQTFYTPAIDQTGGVQTLTPDLYANSSTAHSPTVSGLNTLLPSLFANSPIFYGPQILIGGGGGSGSGVKVVAIIS